MRRLDYRTLLNMGRKAGLHASEIYKALAGHRPGIRDLQSGGTDGNGLVAGYDATGHLAFKPDHNGRNV
jgi:hypothetical protein